MLGNKDRLGQLWFPGHRRARNQRDAALRERDELAEQLAEMQRERDALAEQVAEIKLEIEDVAQQLEAALSASPIVAPVAVDAEFQMRLQHRRNVWERRPAHSPTVGQPGGNILAFLHLPKTGGVTLTDLVRSGLPSCSTLNVIHPERLATAIGTWSFTSAIRTLLALPDAERDRISAIMGHYGHGLHEFLPRKVDYITLLRDPVDRIVSAYYYSTSGNPTIDTDGSEVSLRDYVFRKRHYDLGLDNHSTRVLCGDPRLDPPGPSATTENAPLVSRADFETARENLRSYALAGVLERFDEFVLVLGAALGWSLCDLIHQVKNKTASRPPAGEIPSEIRTQILRWNEFDAELHKEAERILDELISRYPWSFDKDLCRFRELMHLHATGTSFDDLRSHELKSMT